MIWLYTFAFLLYNVRLVVVLGHRETACRMACARLLEEVCFLGMEIPTGNHLKCLDRPTPAQMVWQLHRWTFKQFYPELHAWRVS